MLTRLGDGASVAFNPGLSATLTPVPAALLPPGVAAGTYVEDVGATGTTRIAVVGTVAQVNALLSGLPPPP